MANHEMWDYLDVDRVVPDYNQNLDVTPQKVLVEDGRKNQVVYLGDDNSDEIVSFSDDSVFFVTLQWSVLSEAEAGTIFDFYHDTAKGNGIARSFRWTNKSELTDPHTYTVRFANPLPRGKFLANIHGYTNILLKILGRCMSEIVAQGTFYPSNIATIGDDETHTTDSDSISVAEVPDIAVQGFCTCGSACVATTVIKFLAKVNGAWDDDGNPFATLTIAQTASTTVRKTALLDLAGVDEIKITSIENTEDDNTNGDITAVNCSWSKKQ